MAEFVAFETIVEEFVRRAHAVVWCNVATVDTLGRPRSRILHPYWEGSVGWIGTRPTPLKLRHLAANANVSLAYVGDPVKPVYVDGVAEWIEDAATRRRVWELFRAAAPPLGYDLGTIFASPDDAGFGLLRITPRRIELGDMLTMQKLVWKVGPLMPIVADFRAIEDEFIGRVHGAVWCNVATTDSSGRPRSRVLHTIWEGTTGWIATGRHSFKAKHIAREPHVALTYMADVFKPVYVDCLAAWNDDPATKQRLWELFGAAPPPLGYDLAPFFGSVDSPGYGLLPLTAERIELADLLGTPTLWRA